MSFLRNSPKTRHTQWHCHSHPAAMGSSSRAGQQQGPGSTSQCTARGPSESLRQRFGSCCDSGSWWGKEALCASNQQKPQLPALLGKLLGPLVSLGDPRSKPAPRETQHGAATLVPCDAKPGWGGASGRCLGAPMCPAPARTLAGESPLSRAFPAPPLFFQVLFLFLPGEPKSAGRCSAPAGGGRSYTVSWHRCCSAWMRMTAVHAQTCRGIIRDTRAFHPFSQQRVTVRLTHAWILLASETGVDPAERASCVLLVGTISTFTESTEGISGASATEQREGSEAGWGEWGRGRPPRSSTSFQWKPGPC